MWDIKHVTVYASEEEKVIFFGESQNMFVVCIGTFAVLYFGEKGVRSSASSLSRPKAVEIICRLNHGFLVDSFPR